MMVRVRDFYAIWNIPLLPQGYSCSSISIAGTSSCPDSGWIFLARSLGIVLVTGMNLRFWLRLVMGDGVGLKFSFCHLRLCASSVLSSGSMHELSLLVDVSESECSLNDRGRCWCVGMHVLLSTPCYFAIIVLDQI